MQNETCAKIGRKLKAYRTERGLSQIELAEGICSSSTISLIETGQHLPAMEIMQMLAEKLAVPLPELMIDEENNLDLKLQIDIAKIYVETKQFFKALQVIDTTINRHDVREFQKRELILCRAECLMQTREVQQAINILSDLQQRLEQQRENNDLLMARVYDKLGTAYYVASNFTNAHAHYLRAYQLTQRFPRFDVVSAKIVYNLGMACRQLNRSMDAIEYLTKASAYFQENSEFQHLAQTYFEIGLAYKGAGMFETAERFLRDSLTLYESQNVINMARRVKSAYATVVLSETDPEQAISELKRCALEYEQDGDLVRYAYTTAHLGRVLILHGKAADAGDYLHDIIQKLSAHQNFSFDPRIAFVYQVHAYYLLEINNLDHFWEIR